MCVCMDVSNVIFEFYIYIYVCVSLRFDFFFLRLSPILSKDQNQQFILTSIYSIAIDIKNTSLSHAVALIDVFLHYHENGAGTEVYFESIPHTPFCCCKYSLAAECSPKQMHNLLLLGRFC